MAGQKYLGCPEKLWTIARIKDILNQLNTPERNKLKGRPAIFAKLKSELERLNITTYDALKAHLGGASSLPSPPTANSPTQPPPQASSPSSDGQGPLVTEPVHRPRRRERKLSTHVDLESMGVVYAKWYSILTKSTAVSRHDTTAGPDVSWSGPCIDTVAEYKAKTNDKDKDKDFSLVVSHLELRFSADGSYHFAADVDESKGSCQKYPCRGRGPCWGSSTGSPSGSSALDACIMAGIFLDAGQNTADYGDMPSSDWLKELTDIEKNFLRIKNLDWKNYSLETSRRQKGILLKEGESILSVSAIWSKYIQNFHQFTFHTGCRCGHKKKDNLRQYNKVVVTPKDDKDIECLLREYFAFSNSKSRQCAKCTLRKGRTIYGDLPPRLVVEPESDGDHVIPGSTSASISFDYRNEIGERNTAFYRWIGGIYERQERTEATAKRTHRVYWIDGPPMQDPAQLKIYGSREPHDKDGNPSNLGAVVGRVPPALPEQSVHWPWAKRPALLFYERVGEIVRGPDVTPVSTVIDKRNANRASWGVDTTAKTDEPTMAVDQELSKQTKTRKRKPLADATAGEQPASKKAKRSEELGPSEKVDEVQSQQDDHPAPGARKPSKKTAKNQIPRGKDPKPDGAIEKTGGAPLQPTSENAQRKPQKSSGGKPPAKARRLAEISRSTGRSFLRDAKGVALPKRKLSKAMAVSDVAEDRPAKRQRRNEQPADSLDTLSDDRPINPGKAPADDRQIKSREELTTDSPITAGQQVPEVTPGRTSRKKPAIARPTISGEQVPEEIPDDDRPTTGGKQVPDDVPDRDDPDENDEVPDRDNPDEDRPDGLPSTSAKSPRSLALLFPERSFSDATSHPPSDASNESENDEVPDRDNLDEDEEMATRPDGPPSTSGKSPRSLALLFPEKSFSDATSHPASDPSNESGNSRERRSSTPEESTSNATASSSSSAAASSSVAASAPASLFSGSLSPDGDGAPNPSSSSSNSPAETSPEQIEQHQPAQQDQPSSQDEPRAPPSSPPAPSSSLEEGEIKSSSPEEGEVKEAAE